MKIIKTAQGQRGEEEQEEIFGNIHPGIEEEEEEREEEYEQVELVGHTLWPHILRTTKVKCIIVLLRLVGGQAFRT